MEIFLGHPVCLGCMDRTDGHALDMVLRNIQREDKTLVC